MLRERDGARAGVPPTPPWGVSPQARRDGPGPLRAGPAAGTTAEKVRGRGWGETRYRLLASVSPVSIRQPPLLTWVRGPAWAVGGSCVARCALPARPLALSWVACVGVACVLPRYFLGFCFVKMAPALLLLRRRRRLRALGRRRRPLSLTERRGAGTQGAMAGGRRGAMARPEQSSSAHSASSPNPNPQMPSSALRRQRYMGPESQPRAGPPT